MTFSKIEQLRQVERTSRRLRLIFLNPAILIWLFLLLLAVPAVQAHESRPAYLEINQTSPTRYEVLWHTPVNAGASLQVALKFPDDVRNVTEPVIHELAGSLVERRLIEVNGGLAEKRIEIVGLQLTITDVLVRIKNLNGTTQTIRLSPASPSFVVEAAPGVSEVARTYTVLGIEHILTGIDHLLFVLALLIITQGGWKLVKTVTAFTVSHSVTLTAVTLGLVHVPTKPVEAVIALSIVFVAAEILQWKRGRVGLAAKAPWVVAFAFGLIHGLGFAGGLSDIGLPAGHIPTALLFFSLGVESGHFMFIGAVLLVIALGRKLKIQLPKWAEYVPPYAIGGIAMFWVIERLAAF
jgi:hydrogenase/urease accessory protein HupE